MSEEKQPEIFVVSDGTGETALSTVRAALTQFPAPVRMRSFSEVCTTGDVRRAVDMAV